MGSDEKTGQWINITAVSCQKKPSESERSVPRTRLAFHHGLIGRVQLMGNGTVERVHPGLPSIQRVNLMGDDGVGQGLSA